MRSLSFFLAVICLSGCSYFNLPNPLERSADDYGKTEVGVGTGAVLGAGLGAVIGSASGNAGEGVAIGALAGGATGGLIGRQLEKNDSAVEQQNEALIRQREMISVQEREIGDLRTGFDDAFPNNKPSRASNTAINNFSNDTSAQVLPSDSTRARLDAPEATLDLSKASAHFPISRANASSRATLGGEPEVAVNTITGTQVAMRVTPQVAVQVAPQVAVPPSPLPVRAKPIEQTLEMPAGIADIDDDIMIAKRVEEPKAAVEEIAQVPDKKPIVIAKKMELPRVLAPQVIEKKEEPVKELIVKKEEAKKEVVNKIPEPASKPAVDLASFNPDDLQSYDANCMQAQDEAGRAEKATSDADKLFYYRRALRLCATESSHHVGIAKVYESIGRLDDARFEYGQALQLDPDNATANKNLAGLAK